MEELKRVLEKNDVSPDELLEWLRSESVYTALRYADKKPSTVGIDECEDSDVYSLYDLVDNLRHKA